MKLSDKIFEVTTNEEKKPISIEEYKTLILETAVYPEKVDNFGLAYCWLGLIGETGEAIENINTYNDSQEYDGHTNMTKEVGDVLWYTTAICQKLQLDVMELFYLPYDTKKTICSLCEGIKKFYRDDKPLDIPLIKQVLAKNI